jgi:hypothetical protein
VLYPPELRGQWSDFNFGRPESPVHSVDRAPSIGEHISGCQALFFSNFFENLGQILIDRNFSPVLGFRFVQVNEPIPDLIPPKAQDFTLPHAGV